MRDVLVQIVLVLKEHGLIDPGHYNDLPGILRRLLEVARAAQRCDAVFHSDRMERVWPSAWAELCEAVRALEKP